MQSPKRQHRISTDKMFKGKHQDRPTAALREEFLSEFFHRFDFWANCPGRGSNHFSFSGTYVDDAAREMKPPGVTAFHRPCSLIIKDISE